MSVPAPRKRKRLPCRFSLHDKWVRHKNSEGEDYLQCKACGKDLYDVERHEPDIIGGFAGGGRRVLISTGGGQLAVSAQPVLRPGPTVLAFGRTGALHL